MDQDLESGTITDGGIRYMLMRPDVLMGIGRVSGSTTQFVAALEESVFQNAQASFEEYRKLGLMDGDFLSATATAAARLGWGRWTARQSDGDGEGFIVEVQDSPFAFGMGACDHAVCGPIVGILRAVHRVARGQGVAVVETACAAQGAPCCTFTIAPETAPER